MAIPMNICLKFDVIAMPEKKQAKPAKKKKVKSEEKKKVKPVEKKTAKPAIDKQFWFDLSKEMVEGAASKRNEAAGKLQKFIVWLWGIYTASAAVGIALSKTSYSLPVIILIASPSAILIFAYWLALWVQMPVPIQFDRRISAEIRDAHKKGVKTKSRKLNWAIALSLISAVLVSLALIAASLSKQAVSSDFKAYYETIQERNAIVVAGHFPTDTKITLRISAVPGASKEYIYITSHSGELQKNIELDFTSDKYDVEVEWQEKDGLVRSLRRTVKPKKNKD